MADSPETPEPFSLKRWSQRKRAAQTEPAHALPSPATEAPAAMVTAGAAPAAVPEPAPPLPPVDTLTFDSDYSAFMQPKIAEETKRAALRKLFSDPSFNVMDGLDIYVGDYTQPDPMPSGMLDKLTAAYAMLDPADPVRDEKSDAAAAATIPAPPSAAEADLVESAVTESPAEAAPTPEAGANTEASDTSPTSGSA